MQAGDQHPLPLSQEDLAKIVELVVSHFPTSSHATQTAVAALVPLALSPAAKVVQYSFTTLASSPAATVVQSSLTTPPIEVGTSTLIMAITRTFELVSLMGAHQVQVAVSDQII